MPTTDDFYAIYLYYFLPNGTARMYEWWDPENKIQDDDDLRGKIDDLARNARKNLNAPPYYTTEPTHMIMRRKSYVVFIVNKKYWKSVGTNDIGIVQVEDEANPKPGIYTFAKAGSIESYIGSSDKHAIIYYTNRLLDSDEQPLKERKHEKFRFTLPFERMGSKKRVPDSGGTNMGPPVPPPAGGLYDVKKARARA